MTTDPHGWPDPARPGCPANPERDGWHWLMIGHGIAHPFPMLWCASGDMWEAGDDGYVDAADISTRWRYLGPCLTPAEVAAAVQAEREACLEIIETERGGWREWSAGELAASAAFAIRARGPADALADALAQALREGMEDAAALIEARAEGLHPAWMAIMRREVAAIRSAAGEVGK